MPRRKSRKNRRSKRRRNKSRQHVDAGKQRHESRPQTWVRKVCWKIRDAFCFVSPWHESWR